MNEMPPHDLDTEESVLASLLIDNEAIPENMDTIGPGDFYKTAHGNIFDAIVLVFKQKQPADLVTVSSCLRENGTLHSSGGAGYLARLIDHVPMATNLPHYVKILKGLSIRRQGLVLCEKTKKFLNDMGKDPEESFENAMKCMAAMSAGPEGIVKEAQDIMFRAMDRWETAFREKRLVTGVPTGFEEFDNLLCGLQPSDLIILAARPSMGKTALCLQWLKGAAASGHRVLMFSLEQPEEQLADRLAATRTTISTSAFRSGYFGKDTWSNINEGASYIGKLPFCIDDRGGLSYKEIRKVARREMRTKGVGLIIIDHLQLVRGASNKSRNDEVGMYTGEFKAMAKELKVPVVVLSQLSRNLEQRTSKRPVLSDLRDSGNIEQDADVVAFIYRDEVYNQDANNPNRGKAELIISKQRQGPLGVCHLNWLARSTKFIPAPFEKRDGEPQC